jgi:hypothetical protein
MRISAVPVSVSRPHPPPPAAHSALHRLRKYMPKGGAAPAPEELGYDLEAMTYAVSDAGGGL